MSTDASKYFFETLVNAPEDTIYKDWGTKIKQYCPILWETCNGFNGNKYNPDPLHIHLVKAFLEAEKAKYPHLVCLAALFHDVGKATAINWDSVKKDYTFHKHEIIGAKQIRNWLTSIEAPWESIDHLYKLIKYSGFRFYDNTSENTIKRWLIRLGSHELWEDLMLLRLADRAANSATKNKPLQTKEWLTLWNQVNSIYVKNEVTFPNQLNFTPLYTIGSKANYSSYYDCITGLIVEINKKPGRNNPEYIEGYRKRYNASNSK